MIALAKEKREELANYARARLASHVVHGGCSDEEDIFKIALASLTAEEVNPADCFEPVYLCPPVPEIKLPEMKGYTAPHTQYCEGLVDGYNRCLAEFKRLNGLRE